PRLALSIPGLNAIAPVDHVESHRQGVDDLRGKSALLLYLHRTLDDFTLEPPRIFGRAERGCQHVGHGEEHGALLRRERLGTRDDESAEDSMTGQQSDADETTIRVVPVGEKVSDGLGVECVRSGAPCALEAKSRRLGSLVL